MLTASRHATRAQMAELVDAPASGAGARKGVEVRVLFWHHLVLTERFSPFRRIFAALQQRGVVGLPMKFNDSSNLVCICGTICNLYSWRSRTAFSG